MTGSFVDALDKQMAKKKSKSKISTARESRINFRCGEEEKERFKAAAWRDGMSELSTWLLWLARNRDRETSDSK